MLSRYVHRLGIFLFMLRAFLCLGNNDLYAQDPIGGPYETDSATVLLMHFDQNFKIDHDPSYQIGEPNTFGNISFLEMQGAGDLGHQVRFDNDSPEDNSHIQIPDTTDLDLTGNWTIEMWVNKFSFGMPDGRETILAKPAADSLQADNHNHVTANYFMDWEWDQDTFTAGYHSNNERRLISTQTDQHFMEVGLWYHITHIRDTAKQVILTMLHQNAENPGRLPQEHNDSLELVYFEARSYDTVQNSDAPLTSDKPLYIGGGPRLDEDIRNLEGFMDEVRISNVVRDSHVPPFIDSVSQYFTRYGGENTPVRARILNVGSNQIEKVILHYRTGNHKDEVFGTWQQEPMNPTGSNNYKTSIPAQEIGSTIEYYIEVRNESGLTTIQPRRAVKDSNFYNYVVWMDSTTILELTFDNEIDGEPPRDVSQFSNRITVENGEAQYGPSTGTEEDKALKIPADQPYYLRSDSPFMHFTSFSISFDFIVDGELPTPGTRLLAKRTGPLEKSNYQVWIDTNGVVVPDAYVVNEDNRRRLGPDLRMEDTSINPGQWYELKYKFSTKGDTAFAELKTLEDDNIVAESGTKVTGFPYRGSGPLFIGTGDRETDRYWNGRIDEVKLKNYCARTGLYYNNACDPSTDISTREPPNLPDEFELYPNTPNPFNPTTQIKFSLPQATDVKLAVYDVLGRRVATLLNGKRKAGEHSVTFEAGNLSSGVYIYRLEAEGVSKSRKMLLVK